MKITLLTIILFPLLTFHMSNANAQLPVPDHVIILMEENYGYSDIVDSAYAPHLCSLIGQPNVALFTNSFAITHPSQPNYLTLFFGTNNGVLDDNAPPGRPWSLCNLGSSLIQSGRTWGAYSEGLPYAGFLGDTLGDYASKHCPWVNCQGTGLNQVPDSTNMPFSSFPTSNNYSSLPTVSFIIPNLAHDMHDPALVPSVAIPNADNWFNTNLSSLVSWVKSNNSLLIITFDEDDGSTNNIFTLLIGEMVHGGTYGTYVNHYGMLRTIENMYHLPHCANSATANGITSCWLPISVDEITNKNRLIVYPNPASEKVIVELKSEYKDQAVLSISDHSGRIIKTEKLILIPGNNNFNISTEDVSEGVYVMRVIGESINVCRKVIIRN